MKHTERKQQRDAFKRNEAGLRAILNEWDFIGGAPEDEYDCLTHHLLSALERQGSDVEGITGVITRECTEHFWVEVSSKDAKTVAIKIVRWWKDGRQA